MRIVLEIESLFEGEETRCASSRLAKSILQLVVPGRIRFTTWHQVGLTMKSLRRAVNERARTTSNSEQVSPNESLVRLVFATDYVVS